MPFAPLKGQPMKYLSVRAVSAQIGLGVDAVHRMINDGRLPAIQPGGPGSKLLIPETELERMLKPVKPARDQK